MLYAVDETCPLRFSCRLLDIGKLVRERRETDVTKEISELGEMIGKGAFGEVFKAKWTYYSHGGKEENPTIIDVAVKKLSGDLIQWADETIRDVGSTRSSITLF
jgi:hypothetical protein